jgi:hypothetical protein
MEWEESETAVLAAKDDASPASFVSVETKFDDIGATVRLAAYVCRSRGCNGSGSGSGSGSGEARADACRDDDADDADDAGSDESGEKRTGD